MLERFFRRFIFATLSLLLLVVLSGCGVLSRERPAFEPTGPVLEVIAAPANCGTDRWGNYHCSTEPEQVILPPGTIAPKAGTIAEIPGDGVDNGASSGTFGSCGAGYADAVMNEAGTLRTGCDLLCDAPDQDCDGFNSDGTTGTSGSTAIDPDDTSRIVRPAMYVPTYVAGSPTGYKYAHATNGTFGSNTLTATTPLCESPNGVTGCKYVASTGNDSGNNCQTYATPCLSLAKLSGGSGGSGLPASPITLAPDDYVYVTGTGDITTTFTMTIGGGSIPTVFSPGASGTSGHPIVIKQYPGATARLAGTNTDAVYIPKDFITIDGLRITSTWASLAHGAAPIYVNNADDVIITNTDLTASLHGDYNGACIETAGTNRITTSYNFLHDCLRQTGTVANTAGITWLNNENAGEGADEWSHHDVIWFSTYSNTSNGNCWFQKHGTNLSDTGSNGHRVTYGYCLNPTRAFSWEGSGLRAKGIFAYNEGTGNNMGSSIQSVAKIYDATEGENNEDNRIQYSTFINFSMLQWGPTPSLTGTPGLTVDHNVIVDNDGTYATGNNEGLWSVYPAGLDADFTNFKSYIVANSNIYYNGSATISFQYMRDTGTGKNTGGDYTFANWQALGPFDSSPASYVENPTHNAQFECSSAHCTDATVGWLAATEAAAASGPSLVLQMSPQKKKKKR